jgi:ABC-type uncharacterized transport system ATPase component
MDISDIQEKMRKRIQDARHLYQKLILLVGESGSGKTGVLKIISNEFAVPLINVNLEMSSRLLDVPVEKRASNLSRLFSGLLNDTGSDMVFLDNMEILFDKSLQQNPLSLLQNNAKNRVVIAAWNGAIGNGRLTYARPEHHEFCSYPIEKTGITIDLNPSPDE